MIDLLIAAGTLSIFWLLLIWLTARGSGVHWGRWFK
jgi:hypothetical protein